MIGAASGEWPSITQCKAGSHYQIRVWGRTWDAFTKKTNFVGKAYDGHTEECPAEQEIDYLH